MSDGFQVTMTELLQAAGVFRSEGRTFEMIMPDGGPAPANGGSGDFNGALAEVLEALGGLHIQLAAIIGQHADKLETAYQTYRSAEDAIVRESEGIATPSLVQGKPGG
jgi:hypothetical protein